MSFRRLCLSVTVVAIGLIGFSLHDVAPVFAARGHVCNASFGGPGSGEGEFNRPQGLAVNETTGRVYVADSANNRVEFFSATGVYEGQFNGSGLLAGETKATPTGQFSNPQSIAVDNSTGPSKGDVYVADEGPQVVDKFTESGQYVGQVGGTPNRPFGGGPREEGVSVAVDRTGQLWVAFPSTQAKVAEKRVARFSAAEVNIFIEEWEAPLTSFFGHGLAVGPEGDLYIPGKTTLETTEEELVEKVSGVGTRLNIEVGGERSNGWPAIESSSGDVYIDQSDHVSRYTPKGVLLEHLGLGILTSGGAGGIAVNSINGNVYIVDVPGSKVEVCELEPPGLAKIENESVSEVTAGSATFSGEINPKGAAVEYHFEYGRCPTLTICPSSPYETAPIGLLGAGFEVTAVSVHLQDLSPGSIYHLRLVAENKQFGKVVGEERVFTTQPTGGPLVLPDGRAWQLVTPPDAHGAVILPITESGLTQSSSEGGAFAYLASYPVEPADAKGFSSLVQVLSRRGNGGWSSVDVPLSHTVPVGAFAGFGFDYRFFSEDLSSAVVETVGPFSTPESRGVVEATPRPSERTPYMRHNDSCQQTPATCYTPIVTGAPEGGDVLSGKKFGGSSEEALGDAVFAGATPDTNHVVVSSSVELTNQSASHGGLYEWSANLLPEQRLQLVSLLPENEGDKAAANFQFGRRGVARHAVSNDGSRVFFTAFAPGQAQGHLYMHDTVKDETIRLDVAEGGSATDQPEAFFQSASADGSEVFFTDSFPLTANAGGTGGAGGSNSDLYKCVIREVEEAGSEKLKCELSDLTPVSGSGQSGGGEADVLGSILGTSEVGGGYVYFVANGVQADGASQGDCANNNPLSGESCNLYVSHDGVESFITSLSSDDSPDWAAAGPLKDMTSRVSPDGVWLAFMSDRSLTGYDNTDVNSGLPDEEVFLYNAETRRLVCASCNPTGGRPAGKPYSELTVGGGGLVGGDRVWREGQWLAANVPGWTAYSLNEALYDSRFLSDSGRLFFNSSDGLVPQDTNGDEDVYEYEPVGVGGNGAPCSESLSTFSESSGGCVGLISSGLGFGESAFLDASASGGDVFFLTSEKLVKADGGSAVDVYDASECSSCVSAPVESLPECTSAGACRGAPMTQPQIFGSPASATFSGEGNVGPVVSKPAVKTKPKVLTRGEKLSRALNACKKVSRKKRAGCESRARKQFGPKKPAKKTGKSGKVVKRVVVSGGGR